jgi:6-phosphogluconolactonase
MNKRVKETLLMIALVCGLAFVQGATAEQNDQGFEAVGAVFAATNDANHNEIVMFGRSATGALKYIGRFATGGRGEGGINDPLQSQSSLALSNDHKFLLAVNAGSSSVSVFQVDPSGLRLLNSEPSNGGNPVSITIHDDLVFVANFGGNFHTAGFHLRPSGKLDFISNSKQPLSTLDTEPSTIAFSPDGSKLIVTERQTNKIDVFSVAGDGSLTNPVVDTSEGIEPFGATFAPSGALLVSEAGSGSVSSYNINADNSLSVITSKSSSSGIATCWVITGGTHVFTTSAVTSNISAYDLGAAGDLSPLGSVLTQPGTTPAIFPPIGVTAFPIDLRITPDNQYLYVVFSALGQVIGYQVTQDGKLTQIAAVNAFSPQIGVEGLAVY